MRRADIELRRAVLSAQFQVHHGRPPTAIESLHLAHQATPETRQYKHFSRSYAEQRGHLIDLGLGEIGGPADKSAMVFSPSIQALLARTAGQHRLEDRLLLV